MNFYVITAQGTTNDELDSPVFAMKDADNHSAIMVFTASQSASSYITEANWQADQTVAEVPPTQMLKWLTLAKEDGITHVVVDPDHQMHQEGKPLLVVPLENASEAHADLLKIATEAANAS